jgi:hypothetical protein
MKIRIKAAKAHSSSATFIGYIFMILGFVFGLLTSNPIALIDYCLIGFYFAFSHYGFEVSNDKSRFREYFNYMGLKFGKWRSLEEFPYLTVFYVKQTETTGSGRTMLETSIEEMVYKVYLLNESHREKVLVKQTPNEDEAKHITHTIINELGIEHVKFNPKRTSQRRR